ncbi:hypothetical protein [Peribacillus frigoritolerans]|uniref:hypothetical protein n=1 Tax=Peribacillus frigoritolerans TaxID=450367 RepID=UPI00215AB136|nr:hypothetical protein [Peribacillus frigoritolerans]MCR8867638.1 hypothetical protein [Peribacillus frigoritolerans]
MVGTEHEQELERYRPPAPSAKSPRLDSCFVTFHREKGKKIFYSAEGKRHLEDMLDDFFKERGKLINLIQLEIIKFFEQSRTIDILSVMLVESSVYFKVS